MTVRLAVAPITDHELEEAGRVNRLARDDAENFRVKFHLPVSERTKCRLYPNVTFFFDGTGNNMEEELKKPANKQALSNITKLFLIANSNKSSNGIFFRYVSGVGTPFRVFTREPKYMNLSDDTGGPFGLGFGMGGDLRIRASIAEFMRIIGDEYGPDSWPHIQYITLSVFGFSRGATQARAFVRRMIDQCRRTENGLAWPVSERMRIPLHIPFLGLFDTVASVGGPSLHMSYAKALKIPPEVQRCVHFVAAHEVRQPFPLDSVRVNDSYPGNCEEVVYPGVHADVGGGYAPGTQGRSNKLSMIPLRHMYFEALKAGVPLLAPSKLKREDRRNIDLDADDLVVAAYQNYMGTLGSSGPDLESLIREHRKLHFHWRGTLTRDKREDRLLGSLCNEVNLAVCVATPARTNQDYPPLSPEKWDYGIPVDPTEQAQQLIGEHRRLAERTVFLRRPTEERTPDVYWPPAPRDRTEYEELLLAAWHDTAKPAAAVDVMLAEYVHDSVAHFTQYPCALHDARGVFCDRTRYYAANEPLGAPLRATT